MKKWIGVVSALLLLVVVASLGQWWPPRLTEASTNTDITSSTSDGDITAAHSVWNTVHDAASGDTKYPDATTVLVRSDLDILPEPDLYRIDRGFLYFNTAGLADDCYIVSAELHIYVEDWVSDDNATIIVGEGMATYPHDPLVLADFGETQYSATDLGSVLIEDLTDDAANTITLNAAGRAKISKTATTKFILRTDYDLSDVAPTGLNEVEFTSADGADPNKPTLYIEYVNMPVVTVAGATSVTTTTATLNGEITDTGYENNDYRGFVYGETHIADPGPGNVNPVTTAGGYDTYTIEGPGSYGAATFTAGLVGLDENTIYYYRSWTHNTAGWDYSNTESNFRTLHLPSITLSAASNIANTTARLPGNITDAGYPDPTVGVYYGDDDAGTTASSWDSYLGGAGDYPTSPAQPQGLAAFYRDISGLIPGTKYYFRAAATNTAGTVWAAATLDFTALDTLPTVSTQDADSILDTSATLNGTIGNVGGDPHCDYEGFVWDVDSHAADVILKTTSPSATNYNGPPDVGYYIYSGSFTAGAFDIGMSGGTYGLTTKTTYYYRAFAYNSAGWAYGDEKSFTTAGTPDVTTSAASSMLETSAILNGNITNVWGDNVTTRGFQYGLTGAWGTDWHEDGSWGAGAYPSAVIGGLTPGTHYHFRAYVINFYGTAYGSDLTFTTLPEGPTGLAVFSTGYTTATLTWTSGLHAAKTYIYYSDNAFPTHTPPAAWPVGGTAGYGGASGAYGGAGSADIISLSTGTHYYVRAWSWVSGSNVWSNDYSDVEFTTGTIPPQNFIVKVVSSTSFHMWWKVSGATTDNAVINYNLSTYPTSPPPTPLINDVNIYKELNGVPGVWDYLYEGASPGTTYFLSIWFQNGLVYTASDNAVVTTPAASSEDILFPTVDNTTYSQVDSSGLTGAPGYGIMAWVATCMVISTDNWFMLIFALMVAFGVALIGIVTRSVIATLFIGLILTWLGVTLHLLPLWYVLSLMILAPVPAYIRGGGESTMG